MENPRSASWRQASRALCSPHAITIPLASLVVKDSRYSFSWSLNCSMLRMFRIHAHCFSSSSVTGLPLSS